MSRKKNKKEVEFEKLVDEEEIEEMAYDEDDSYEVSYNNNEEFNLNNEVKALKILTCISICITIVSLLISLVILSKVTGTKEYSSGSGNGNVQDDGTGSSQEVEYDTSMFTEISMDDFMAMYKGKEEYFVYTGRKTCGYCVAFLPTLQKSVEEYNYTLYYLDIDKLDSDDLTEIAELHEDFEETIGGTPMVYVMGKKDVKDINRGYTEYDTYAKFLEKNDVKERK